MKLKLSSKLMRDATQSWLFEVKVIWTMAKLTHVVVEKEGLHVLKESNFVERS